MAFDLQFVYSLAPKLYIITKSMLKSIIFLKKKRKNVIDDAKENLTKVLLEKERAQQIIDVVMISMGMDLKTFGFILETRVRSTRQIDCTVQPMGHASDTTGQEMKTLRFMQMDNGNKTKKIG